MAKKKELTLTHYFYQERLRDILLDKKPRAIGIDKYSIVLNFNPTMNKLFDFDNSNELNQTLTFTMDDCGLKNGFAIEKFLLQIGYLCDPGTLNRHSFGYSVIVAFRYDEIFSYDKEWNLLHLSANHYHFQHWRFIDIAWMLFDNTRDMKIAFEIDKFLTPILGFSLKDIYHGELVCKYERKKGNEANENNN